MDSDSEECILEDSFLTSQNDFWDEDLNDDLLCSDEEDLTTSVVSSHLEHKDEDEATHVAEELRLFTGEQQAEEELDTGEVLDVRINEPLGDEFQKQPRETIRQQEEDPTTEETGEENLRLHLKAERKATAAVTNTGGKMSGNLSETPGLCERDRSPLQGRVNKSKLPGRGKEKTHRGTQSHLYGAYGHTLQDDEIQKHWETPESRRRVTQSPFSLPHQSPGGPPKQVLLTSAQNPANPAVDPSSLQDDADSSRRLQVQIDPLGVHTEQHMFSQQLFSLEPDSAPLLCGLIPAHPWGPCCSPQKDRGLPTIKKPPQSFLCIAGGASLQPVSSRNTKEKVQFLPLKTQRCVNQPFPPDQTQLPAQTLLHPKPHVNQSSASSMQAPHPGHLGFPSIQSQSSPQILPDPLNCAVIRPRMTQISPNSAHVLSDPPVLAQNTSFITTARPTPTPAAQVRPVARAVAGAVARAVAGAVARGMPGAARDGACARVAPEPELTGKSQGQEVREDPHSSQSLLCEEKKGEMEEETKECGVGDDDKDTPCQNKAGEDEDGVTVWYQLQLEKQKRLREKLNLQKEKRRHMQAQNRWKQRQEKLQDVSPTLLEKKGQQDQTPLQYPQKPQGNKQIRSIPNLPETPTSNLPQHQQRCSFNSKSHSNPQKCGRRQQQQPSLLLPPLLKPRSKQGYPPAPLAHSLTAELVCEGTGEKHRRRSRKLRKRMVKDLPLKVRVVKHSRLEEKDDGMSVWVPAQANKGSRVVTFTRTQSYGRDTFRQLNNSHQPVKQ